MSGVVFPATTARSQFGTPVPLQSTQVEAERTQRWKVGTVVTAARGPCAGIYGTFSVPTDWPEQDVKVVDEVISDTVRKTGYRDLEDGVRQMVFAVAQLQAGEKAEALVTFEITRRVQPVPGDTSIYRLPEQIPRDARQYLGSSPFIDCRNMKIRSLAKELTADKESAWEKIQALRDWVQENVQHTNDPLRGSLETLREKKGSHQDLAGLFIALCRAVKVPARTVWVPGYCYAEFFLEDDKGKGEWFPSEFKEKTVFGTVSQPYMILQKGENVKVPEEKEPQRFVPEHLKVKSGQKPDVSFIREVLAKT